MSQGWPNQVIDNVLFSVYGFFLSGSFVVCKKKNFFFFSRPVSVYKFIGKNTIEENIHQVALEKLNLEKKISSEGNKEKGNRERGKVERVFLLIIIILFCLFQKANNRKGKAS